MRNEKCQGCNNVAQPAYHLCDACDRERLNLALQYACDAVLIDGESAMIAALACEYARSFVECEAMKTGADELDLAVQALALSLPPDHAASDFFATHDVSRATQEAWKAFVTTMKKELRIAEERPSVYAYVSVYGWKGYGSTSFIALKAAIGESEAHRVCNTCELHRWVPMNERVEPFKEFGIAKAKATFHCGKELVGTFYKW